MKNFYLIFLLVFTSLFFLGCNNGLEGFTKGDKTLSLTTFNMNLTEDLPLYEERVKQIEKVLFDADADVVCIQGVFYSEDVSAVKKVMNDKGYGVNHSNTDNSDPEIIPPSCMDNDLAPVMACYMNNCLGETDPTCVVTNCWGEMLALPAECRNCLLGEGIGGITGDITDLLGNCTQEEEIIYSKEGKNGVILATRLTFQDKVYEVEKLSSTGTRSVAISAMIADKEREGLGKIHIVCSGLSQAKGDYDGLNESWEQEQLLQVQELKDIAESKESDLAIIMGDFQSNVVGGENILENNPGPIALFEADGWYDPYFDVDDDDNIECTICPENPMVQAKKESVPDHIIFSTKDNLEFFTERVFLNRFTLIDEENKTRTRYSISDHYGIKTIVTKTDR